VAEVGEGDRFEKASNRALKSYNDGLTKSEDLSPADSTRLSLMLNFSVFCFETLEQQEEGLRIAKQAIEEAEEDLDKISPSEQQDSKTVLQFLSENVALWEKKEQEFGSSGEVDELKRNLFQ